MYTKYYNVCYISSETQFNWRKKTNVLISAHIHSCFGRCSKKNTFKAKGDRLGWDMRALKYTARITDSDLIYASFISEVRCYI